MTTSPADELKAAAQTLRARIAQANAPLATTLLGGTRDLFGKAAPDRAVMHPGVGLALADWLDSWVGIDFSEHAAMPGDLAHALAVARQINGTTTTTHTTKEF